MISQTLWDIAQPGHPVGTQIRHQVYLGIVNTAIAIRGEDPATENHTQRAQWAYRALMDTQTEVQRMLFGVLVQPAIRDQLAADQAPSDADILSTIAALVPAYMPLA